MIYDELAKRTFHSTMLFRMYVRPNYTLSLDISVLTECKSIQTKYTLGPDVDSNRYHVDVVRSPLTRNLGARFSDVRDEIVQAFSETLTFKDDGKIFPSIANSTFH